MSMEKYELESYAVSLMAEGDAHALRPVAIIHARTASKALVPAQVYLRFYRSGVELPANSRVENEDGSRMFMVSFPFEQLTVSIDLLRNESPMFFMYNAKRKTGYLATSDEPVGEGETDADFSR
jgi:hypothetical protein